LLHELVRGIKVGGDGPFTNPHRGVPGRVIPLNPVEVWGWATSARASFGAKFKLGGRLLTAHTSQVGLWVGVSDSL
jgi:hypothetical protein